VRGCTPTVTDQSAKPAFELITLWSNILSFILSFIPSYAVAPAMSLFGSSSTSAAVEVAVEIQVLRMVVGPRSPVTTTDELKMMRICLLELRDMVKGMFIVFYNRCPLLSAFSPPLDDSVGPALAWVLSITGLILTGKTDATPEAVLKANAIWWLANYCVGGDLVSDFERKYGELRVTAKGGLFNPEGNKAVQDVKDFSIALKAAWGLVSTVASSRSELSLEVRQSDLLEGFRRKLQQLHTTLARDFGFELEEVSTAGPARSKYR